MQACPCGLYHAVLSLESKRAVERTLDVGSYACLYLLHVHIIGRAGAEAYRPSDGQFAAERHSAATARAVAHDDGMRHLLHIPHKGVGSAEAGAVDQDNDRFLPAHTVHSRTDVLCPGLGEVIVALACLV